MVREIKKLSPRGVETQKKPGRHSDGGGLYLQVDTTGAKRWVFIFRWKEPGRVGAGRLREMGLGGFDTVSLAQARGAAEIARKQVHDGIDPIAAKKASAEIPTFGEMADKLVADLSPQWKNEKHKAQWASTLKGLDPEFRAIKVSAITTADVLKVLTPIWTATPESASRLRGRIERVLTAAKVQGYRAGENPAAWRGHLDHLLPKRQRLSRGHHAALPYVDLPDFMAELRKRPAVAALALEFVVLTVGRTGEVVGALKSEMDLDAKVWTVPPERMKGGREHRVPLSPRAVEIVKEASKLSTGPFVFPGQDEGEPLSEMAMLMLLRRMNVTATTHGFRSSFRDWVGEETSFPESLAEAALAHLVGDATERAYKRGDALEKRRRLMDSWAGYCAGKAGGKVVGFAGARR